MSRVDIARSTLNKILGRRKKAPKKDAPAKKPVKENSLSSEDLMTASILGDIEWANKLLEEDVDIINYQDADGVTPLMVASREGNAEMVEFLLGKDNCRVDLTNNKGKSSLMLASKCGHAEVVLSLLQHNAKINMQSKQGKSALMVASKYGHNEVVELLLLRHADLHLVENEQGNSALYQACEMGHLSVAESLIDNGASLNMRCNDGSSILMVSITSQSENSVEIVEMLLKKGAQVEARDNEGHSALMYSIALLDRNISQLLLDHGAKVDCRNNEGDSVLTIYRHIRSNNYDYNTLLSLITSELTEIIMEVIESGAEVNMQNTLGHTPLIVAGMMGQMQIADYLLEHGAKINPQDGEGKSSLIHAVENEHAELATHLIQLGAKVNVQDKEGWFPLMYAVKAEDLDTVQVLVACGASVHLRNSNGQTIFEICSHKFLRSPLYHQLFQMLLNTVNEDLKLDPKYPGVIFYKTPVSLHITSSAATLNQLDDLGISISVPEHSLRTPAEEEKAMTTDAEAVKEKPLKLQVCPCFCGPFELPKEYRSASPAFLIHLNRKVNFCKAITIKIHHYVSLNDDKDCERMSFLSASTIPEYQDLSEKHGVQPIYTFKKLQGAKMAFREQVGEVLLKHFCFVKAVKRKREEEQDDGRGEGSEAEGEDEGKAVRSKRRENDQQLYSVRLYRSIRHYNDVDAIFCMCLANPSYIKHCDKVIIEHYTGMSEKGKTHFLAQIIEDRVTVHANSENYKIIFDRRPSHILKRDIHFPEKMMLEVSELLDYPPRLSIYATQLSPSISLPELQVIGLDEECTFPILTPLQSQMSLASSPPSSRQLQALSPTIPSCDFTIEAINSDPLSVDDLGDVLEAVEPLSSRWRRLCTSLRLREDELDVIKGDSDDVNTCLHKSLSSWLRLNYDHARHGRPSWRRLAEAVQRLDYGLFEKIAKSHTAH